MAGIELIDIHKTYLVDNREIPVLNGINLSLPAGRITVILGQSGCGKTTQKVRTFSIIMAGIIW